MSEAPDFYAAETSGEEESENRPRLELVLGGAALSSHAEKRQPEPRPGIRPDGVMSFRTDDVAKYGFPGYNVLPGLDNMPPKHK